MFSHEKLDVYRLSLQFVAWAYNLAAKLGGKDRHAKDHLLEASQSILQNIAEGNGKRSIADRRRFFEIARGSTFECAAITDVLSVTRRDLRDDLPIGKELLERIASMLTRMTDPSDRVSEETADYELS